LFTLLPDHPHVKSRDGNHDANNKNDGQVHAISPSIS